MDAPPSRLRLGLIGAGDMGAAHAAAYAAMPDVEIAAIAGRGEARARALAARLGVRVAADPSVVLDDESIEAVDVTVPTAVHRETVIAALGRGKHVFCETPLAARVEDAEAMIGAARASARLLSVALLSRVAEPGLRVREILRSGDLGRTLVVSTERLWPGLGVAGTPGDHHGDALEEVALFDLDWLVWCFGMPRGVSTVAPPRADGRVDHGLVVLDFDGTKAFVEASRVMPAGWPFEIAGRVVAERGAVSWSVAFPPGTGASAPPAVRLTRYDAKGGSETARDFSENPYQLECRHFVDSLRGRADPALLDASAALDGLRVLQVARRSLREGRTVAPS